MRKISRLESLNEWQISMLNLNLTQHEKRNSYSYVILKKKKLHLFVKGIEERPEVLRTHSKTNICGMVPIFKGREIF